MIVRTYGRRGRSNIGRSYSGSAFNDVVSDGFEFEDSSSQESPKDHIFAFPFLSQDSDSAVNIVDADPYSVNSSQESHQLAILPPKRPINNDELGKIDGIFQKSKKARNGFGKKEKSAGFSRKVAEPATLMETQEFGEMIEHVDEVNFALDGLRKGQPVRVRRASLLSLLTICGTLQQRRVLRTHGTAKTIIDAVLGLNFDDTPSNLAAATLFYILTSEGHEDHILDSPSSIRFLLKLLKPFTSDATRARMTTFGSKLSVLRKDTAPAPGHDDKGTDSSCSAILLKVQEILVSYKEIKPKDGKNDVTTMPELSPKWIALLTMEKACLSTISLEETSGMVRKTSGNFKERLREHGGLDAVFEVTRNCHNKIEEWLEQHSSWVLVSSNHATLETLAVLLKCLKILENATFLSEDNQSHLLGIEGNLCTNSSLHAFTKLVLSVIKILSGVSLLLSSSGRSGSENSCCLSNGASLHASEMSSQGIHEVSCKGIRSITSSLEGCNVELISSQQSSNATQKNRKLSDVLSEFSKSRDVSSIDAHLLKMRVDSSTSVSCSGTSHSTQVSNRSFSSIQPDLGKNSEVSEISKVEYLEESQDPFAFDEDEFQPSKWDLLLGKPVSTLAKTCRAPGGEDQGQCQALVVLSQQESGNEENHHSHEASCSSSVNKETPTLLADCLLTAVKVLMNLTNDNPVGCKQIAAFGGLEILSSLIAAHFPSFSSQLNIYSELRDKSVLEVVHRSDKHLSDQELDFLVAILGLLVNLVEKDGVNRARLAATSVSMPGFGGLEYECRDVIPLLCSIFLANQGAREAAEEGKHSTWDEEDPVLQGEKEAEKMIVEAYSALLLAFLSTESKSIRNAIVECLPDHSMAILVPVLERFLEFHLSLNMISPETHTAVLEVIDSCRVT